jgi:hypothetical protein
MEDTVGPERGGRIMLGRTAAEESSLVRDEERTWAELDSELDVAPWIFPILMDELEDE